MRNLMSSPTKRDSIEIREKSTDSITRRQWMILLIVLVVCAIGTYYGYKELQSRARAASCPHDVWEIYQALRSYAADHDGLTPPISRTRGNLMMDPDGFYPEYLTNSCCVQCEWGAARLRDGGTLKNDELGIAAFNDDSFCYIPWVIRNEEEGLAFIDAYRSLDLEDRDRDLVVTIAGEKRILPRTRLTKETVQEVGGSRVVPIIIEWPDLNHYGGSVEYVGQSGDTLRIGDGFPMTKAFVAGLREIASLDRPVPE